MGEIKVLTSYAALELDKIPSYMRRAGDTKIIYDPQNDDEVSVAEDQFDSLVKKGFKAFKVKKDGEAGREIKTFKPNEGMYILVPPIVGG